MREDAHDVVALVQAQQAVVDEHAGELVADGLVQQRGDHGGIHATGKPQQHLALPHLRAHAGDGIIDDVAGVPGIAAAADLVHEAAVDALALLRVRDLRMELQRVEAAGLVGHAGDGHITRGGDELEPLRQAGDVIAVAHPHVEQAVTFGIHAVFDGIEQLAVAAGADLGIAELVHLAGLHLAAQLLRHGLHAVADAEHGNLRIPHGFRREGCIFLQHRLGAAGQNDAFRIERGHIGVADIPGMYFAVDAELANTARDELRVLRAEVEDEDAVGVDVLLRRSDWILVRLWHLCGSLAGLT